jgi:regulator of ribonuclease activity B
MIHPNDDNGDVLRKLEAKGDSLTLPRDIDFAVVFRGEDAARRFGEHFRAQGYKVSFDRAETEPGFPWDVIVVRHMVPSYQAIGDFEAALQEVADTLGGHNDGWGCITQEG